MESVDGELIILDAVGGLCMVSVFLGLLTGIIASIALLSRIKI